MFKLETGRDCFYQWDSNLRLIVNDNTINEVHYCNRTDSCSLITEVYTENGLRYSNIPNVLLTKDLDVNVYAYDTNYTKYSAKFKVCKRSKPADYVYTETEVKNWDSFKKDVENELTEMRALISAIPQFDIQVVEALPTIGEDNIIYLVKADEEENNLYTEHIYIDGSWELLGSAKVEVDLSEYVKNTDIATTAKAGLGYATNTYGIMLTSGGQYRINPATDTQIKGKTTYPYAPITAKNMDFAVKHSLTTNANTLTDAEKGQVKSWLGISEGGSGSGDGIKYYNAFSISPISEGSTNATIFDASQGGTQTTVKDGDIARFNNKLWLFQGVSNGGWTQLN